MARTVLLADDSVTAQNMGRRILMDAGYEVVTVNNGSAALKKIHENHPDLIVLDVYMPGYGGLEVCQRLKEAAETARIPVLLSVGKMEPFKAEEAKRVRADGHIVKPFEASELLAALTRLEDKIVPQAQAEASGGRSAQSEKPVKKSRSWRGGDPLAGAEEVPTERVAYLNEVKKRRSHEAESEEVASSEQTGSESAEQAPRSASPVVMARAAAEDFAVQESAIPTESDAQPVETQAAESRAEAASIFDAPTVEIAAAEIPAGETPANHENVSKESRAEESASEVQAEQAISEAPPAVAAAASPARYSRWIAENVALSVEEASVALEAEMRQAQAASRETASASEAHAHEQVTSSREAVAQAVPETEIENSSGAAFAAAASASSDAVSSQLAAFDAQPAHDTVEAPASQPEVEPDGRSDAPSEATLAWKNWQHIRDSVMSPQKTEALAESVAEMAQAHAGLPIPEPLANSSLQEDPAAKQHSAPSESASAAPAEPAAELATEDNSINDIVDSVLADLKPRLMQEIAKKLAAKK